MDKKPVDDTFDPYENRILYHPLTNARAFFLILKTTIGSGILDMPEAFQNAGYIIGLIGTVILGELIVYCLIILSRSQYNLCKRHRLPMLTYPEAMKLALTEGPGCLKFLSNPSVYIVDGFLIMNQYGVGAIYIDFIAENLQQFFQSYVINLSERVFICILFVPLVLLCMIREIHKMLLISVFTDSLGFIALVICMHYISDLPPLSERNMVASVTRMPLFLGMLLFALDSLAVTTSIQNRMVTPTSYGGFCGVLNGAMFIIIILYLLIGFFGYWKFGETDLDSVALFLPLDEPVANAARIMFAIKIIFSYAAQEEVTMYYVWELHFKKICEGSNKIIFYEYLTLFTNVLISFLLAIAIPHLGICMSLVGAFCLSVLGFTFPAILELCVHWPNELGRYNWILIKDILFTIWGLFGLICGTYTSISEILGYS